MNRIVEYVFFFGFMAVVGFVLWTMLAPFLSALALSAIIVTICYPIYERLIPKMPRQNRSLAAFLTTLFVIFVIVIPLFALVSMLVNEVISFYNASNAGDLVFIEQIETFESSVTAIFPRAELDIASYMQQATSWVAGNLGAIFAGTASTIFLFFVAMIGSFYLFRDGRTFTRKLVVISPLPDDEDELILERLAIAVRSVATGTVLVALIQGTLTALGLFMVGFDRAILWGAIAAFGALIPGVGTTIVFVPSIIYLLATGSYVSAVILVLWAMLAVGLIDNLLGPYLMSRGNKLHPFLILLSVLGGIATFGPIGFVVGPVIVSLFIVLLELYSLHISDNINAEELQSKGSAQTKK